MTSSLKCRIGLGIIVALALWSGLWLREWIYPASEAYRFRWDMNNAWKQGMIILDAARAPPDISKTSPTLGQVYRSYLTRYDAAIAASVDGRYQLDYPPGRLLLIAVWVWANSIAEQVPPESIDTVIWPLLMLNTAFELLCTIFETHPTPSETAIKRQSCKQERAPQDTADEKASGAPRDPIMGPTLNAAALLDTKLGWKLDTLVGWPVGLSLSVRTALILVYGASLLLCSFGLARHDLRNDRRILIAFAAPWVLMFAFLAQMHDRYLVWGALLTAVGAGVSPGATLLHIVSQVF